ncbi:transcription elongation factor GreA [[Clostridium] methylpentosum DSM 5476]|jgi:transcription elongation factor GreA|uniref:Transcription elongation factor GreA n=1 Tax=[Clostridium] methylpentosum DSM 5476 TaxID=537013 RepID=C0E8I6_9FIRM|nr:transcription elongation factor GreA [[Clostridium] methylpentosum DSM 5476]MEE1491588.1 transcription elongation factor GreA [Massilioclostridium sp.]
MEGTFVVNKQTILTGEGLSKLEEELEELKTVKRQEVAAKIKVALSFGDLSENSEYDEAKNEQAMVEARIAQVEAMLKNVHVLDDSDLPTDIVSIGSKVLLKDIEFDEDVEYYIVGSTEADPSEGKISDESPVGKALLGHRVGDRVEVEVPSGMIEFEVLEISK